MMNDQLWHVYILECGDGRLYTGMTSDLPRRLRQHRSGNGGKFTRAFGATKIVYSKAYPNKSQAAQSEVRIKQLTKIQKLDLVAGKLVQ